MEAAKALMQWWEEGYAQCSLRDPATKDIFRKLWEAHGPFRHVSPASTQHLWYIDNCKILEIYTPLAGEKAGHDRNSDTLFYESWSPAQLIKTWLRGEFEWGEVVYHLSNVKVRWRKGKDRWIWREQQGKPVETMRIDGKDYWMDRVEESYDLKVTERLWSDGGEVGASTLTVSKDTTTYEERVCGPNRNCSKYWEKAPRSLSKGKIDNIEGNSRSICRWEMDSDGGLEVWEKWERGVLVWSKEKRQRGEGWEVVERQNWAEAGWQGLAELLKAVLSAGTMAQDIDRVLQEGAAALPLCTQLATLIHMEVNTLRRNQSTTQEILTKLSSLAALLSPGNMGISPGQDLGEQLANTLERLLDMEKTVKLRKSDSSLGEEMEEFPTTLQQCFFLGLDLLSQAASQRPTEAESAELLRSTQWMRQSPPLDSNTNRLMLVNFLKKALGLTMKLVR